MSDHRPLFDPHEPPPRPCSVEGELGLARKALDKYAEANIHDHTAMLGAAAGLDFRLRSLVAAIEAERGER
jgi:hypothetical protein